MLVRTILDTCTVRNHLHPIGKRLDFDAIRLSSEQLRFSLAGGTGVELLEQLAGGQISWYDWTCGIATIDSLLDQRWPLLPTGRQLAALAGTQTDIELDIEAERRHLQACWALMRNAQSTSDLQRDLRYEGSDGQPYHFRLELPKLKAVATAERAFWISYIRHIQSLVPSLGINTVTEADILLLMKMNQGTYPGDPPNLGDKLDAVARLIAYLVSQALKPKDAYNPESAKKHGDAFDISLLFYVPLPSVICSADEVFVSRLRRTDAPHSRQVVAVDEFNRHVSDGTVGTLVNDFLTAGQQLRRWQESAYFRWLKRNQPIGDDLCDWFAAEPLA